MCHLDKILRLVFKVQLDLPRDKNYRNSRSLEYRSESCVYIGDKPEDGCTRKLIPLNVSHSSRIVNSSGKTHTFANFSFLLNYKFMTGNYRLCNDLATSKILLALHSFV